jgi:hypothetical protein
MGVIEAQIEVLRSVLFEPRSTTEFRVNERCLLVQTNHQRYSVALIN